MQEKDGTAVIANLLTGLGVDEYFTRTDVAWQQNFLTDSLGSTVALADASGLVATEYTYGPFGNTAVTGAATTNSLQYTGRENDDTGLYYYRARYYNPMLQRFVSQDPIGFAGGMNSYAYAGNSPVSLSDPLGLKPKDRPGGPGSDPSDGPGFDPSDEPESPPGNPDDEPCHDPEDDPCHVDYCDKKAAKTKHGCWLAGGTLAAAGGGIMWWVTTPVGGIITAAGMLALTHHACDIPYVIEFGECEQDRFRRCGQ